MPRYEPPEVWPPDDDSLFPAELTVTRIRAQDGEVTTQPLDLLSEYWPASDFWESAGHTEGTSYAVEGWIDIPEDGEYGIWLRSRGPSRVHIGDWSVDYGGWWRLIGASVRRLKQGRYPFFFEYAPGTREPFVMLQVTRPGEYFPGVPAEWLLSSSEQAPTATRENDDTPP